ncbi:MAG: riboflavin biosynthesis protein RibF [Prevotella sp.]|nr:riboflavin biosynthesis protein RibF [Prevotella sp.]
MNSVATIGFFDGVHRGHQFVVRQVAEEARKRGLEAVVVTFDRPPREVVTGQKSPLLTTLDEKKRLILAAGADRCEILPFTPELAALSARQFMQTVLKEQLRVEVLMLGYDNRFGHRSPDRPETFDDYQRYARELGMEVLKMPVFMDSEPENSPPFGGVRGGSSSTIRHALRDGNIALATELLGRPYSITGRVVHGRGEGHRIGFPTANIAPESVATILPKSGVYAVEVKAPSNLPQLGAATKLGMMNIGTRPTYDGDTLSLEVHIIDFDGDLYGQTLTVDFLRRIRDEQPFDSTEALRKQLEKDRADCVFSRNEEGGTRKEERGARNRRSLAERKSNDPNTFDLTP